MRNEIWRLAPLAVSALVLTSCNGRTILHGSKLHRVTTPIAAAIKAVTQPTDRAEESEDTAKGQFKVWFVKSEPHGVRFISVARKPLGSKDPVEQSVRELLDGPTNDEAKSGYGTEIPGGTILIGMTRKGNDIELNLSRRFAMDGGTTSFETRIEQLRRTVTPIAGRANVYLDVEGHRLNVEEGEGIEISQPINKLAANQSLN